MASKLEENKMVDIEETIYYWLFPHDSNWEPITEEEKLNNLISEFMAFLHPYIEDYIWYNEAFTLSVIESSSYRPGELRSHIGGKMVVLDYLEDEWFVFFLLTSLTKAFPHLICRVVDHDGEFALIEAALHLPTWANPDTAEYRVFIREGCVHLVPPSLLPIAPRSSRLSCSSQITMAALGHVTHSPTATLASPAIQSAIALRIEEYPRKISREHHSTHAFVPVAVAALLHEYPTLVSAAVRAFCNRDALDNKCLRVMRHFPPETRVLTSVRFSKALYALVSAHPFSPDVRTGWNIPPKDNNAHVIGMKLACGFEILVCSAGGVAPSLATTPEDDLDASTINDNDPVWLKYKGALKERGYFRGELEGSKLFRELESNAHRFFLSNKLSSGKGKQLDNLSAGSIVVKLLSTIDADYGTFRQKEKALAPPDDENWLELNPDALEEMLEAKFNLGETPKTTKSEKEISDALNAFLKHTSSHQGAEVPEELQKKVPQRKVSGPGRKKSSGNGPKLSGFLNLHHPQHRKVSSNSNTSDSSEMSSLSAKVDFNADSFTDALNNILEFSVPEDEYAYGGEDDSSGMSSYEEDNDDDVSLSRKSSEGSKASSGVGADAPRPQPPTRPPRKKKSYQKKIPLAHFDDFDDFDEDDVEDVKAVTQLLQTLKEEAGTGPTSSLLTSLGFDSLSK